VSKSWLNAVASAIIAWMAMLLVAGPRCEQILRLPGEQMPPIMSDFSERARTNRSPADTRTIDTLSIVAAHAPFGHEYKP
jgi:hypothetical protein